MDRGYANPAFGSGADQFQDLMGFDVRLLRFESLIYASVRIRPVFAESPRRGPTASLSVVSLSDIAFGPLLTAFGRVLSNFVNLSLPDVRPAGSVRQGVLRK